MTDFRPSEDRITMELWNGWLCWLGRDPTDEELCHQIRTSPACRHLAWDILIKRKPNIDHFIKIAQETKGYQERCFAQIVKGARSKEDLMFVIARTWIHMRSACKKLVNIYELTRNELAYVFRRLSPSVAVKIVHYILTGPIKRTNQLLYALRASLPQECRAFLAKAEREAFEKISKDPHERVRVQMANKYLRVFKSRVNTLRVFTLFENEQMAPWLRMVAQKCVDQNGVISWKRICSFVPNILTKDLYDTLHFLVRLDGTKKPLHYLLIQTFGGRKLAATFYLTHRNLSAGELCLLVRYAPPRQRMIAAVRLLHYRSARIQHLTRIWNRVVKLRSDVEKRLLKKPLTEERAKEIRRYSPALLKELLKKTTVRESKAKS